MIERLPTTPQNQEHERQERIAVLQGRLRALNDVLGFYRTSFPRISRAKLFSKELFVVMDFFDRKLERRYLEKIKFALDSETRARLIGIRDALDDILMKERSLGDIFEDIQSELVQLGSAVDNKPTS